MRLDWCIELDQFNKDMLRSGRNVILFVDNATSHCKDVSLSNVKLVFLPPNTTALLQPLDQGIINVFKKNYRKNLLFRVISGMDSNSSANELVKSISVVDACRWIWQSVKEIKPETVSRCFQMCGFLSTRTDYVCDDVKDDEHTLNELMIGLNLPENQAIDFDEFLTMDQDIPVHEELSPEWEKEIINEISEENVTEPNIIEPNDIMTLSTISWR